MVPSTSPCSFDLSREVVAVSLDLFDRFMASRGNECTGNLALLASLTTLHIACKLHNHESKKIKLATLASLSRGQFGPKHIEEMELRVLSALGWKLHPPTQYAFVSHLMLLLPVEAHPTARKEMFELSRYLTELAVCDTYFVGIKHSAVAFAAILNVMDDLPYARLPAGIRAKFLRDLAETLGLSYADPIVVASRDRLRSMFSTPSTHSPTDVVSSDSLFTKAAAALTSKLDDSLSLASSSALSSAAGSVSSQMNKTHHPPPSSSLSSSRSVSAHSRSNSFDSTGGKGSGCRFAAQSPQQQQHQQQHHRSFVLAAAASPLSNRTKVSGSPMVAGVQ